MALLSTVAAIAGVASEHADKQAEKRESIATQNRDGYAFGSDDVEPDRPRLPAVTAPQNDTRRRTWFLVAVGLVAWLAVRR